MTVSRVPAGVPTGGQFAGVSRAEGGVALAPADATELAVPVRVAVIADLLLAGARGYWFRDESYQPDDDDWEPDLVNLALMDDPDLAVNNCHAASYAAWEAIDDADANIARLSFTTSTSMSPVHFAPTVVDPETGRVWVIDFTARQYDQQVAFPLVEPLESWRGRIDGYVSERGWTTVGFEYEFEV